MNSGSPWASATQRPDKEWKEGPDNLWGLRDTQYLLIECKYKVEETRTEIHKQETGQMNNSCAWFKNNYPGALSKNIMIIWTKAVALAAGFIEDVGIMRRATIGDASEKRPIVFPGVTKSGSERFIREQGEKLCLTPIN